ncbi:hypothetical protein ACFW5W_34075 [Streptomyces sp. NPDC058783]|uniref:hypothetical protein n=1 Tax=Streptomyces sp. NPDC058783 TaxID=3346633 RepID=UPI0036CA5C71
MRDETAEQNRYQRALTALPGSSREPSTVGHTVFWDVTGKILKEHPPAEGSEPSCQGCGTRWPCEMAEAAMQQVGVHA